jgi:peptidoglycan/LPS O-acetylase OafA/YrhL
MVWLGTVSYGIYLFQTPALAELRTLVTGIAFNPDDWAASIGAGQTVVLAASAAVATVAIAAASWYLVERPAQRRWGRRTFAAPGRSTQADCYVNAPAGIRPGWTCNPDDAGIQTASLESTG